MKREEGYFKDNQGTRIYHQSWLPQGEPKAALLVVHGLAEHSGRYASFFDHFCSRGFAVSSFDLPGHGRSEGMRGYVNRFSDYTDTLSTFHDMICSRWCDQPLFLVGHSMGGLIAALYLLDRQEELAGAVLSGPLVKAHGNVPAAAVWAGKLFSALAPKFKLIALDAADVSRDPAVVRAYDTDPLVYRGKITARLGSEMLKAMRRITDEAPIINLPLLILQGSEDRLVDPSGSQLLFELAASPDKRIIVYEGLYHEVYNEPEHDRVFKDVEMWLEDRLAQPGFDAPV